MEAQSIDLPLIFPNDSMPIEDIHQPLRVKTKPREVQSPDSLHIIYNDNSI